MDGEHRADAKPAVDQTAKPDAQPEQPAAGASAAVPVPAPTLGRRRFVIRALAATGGVVGAVLALPIAGFVGAPALSSSRPARFISTSIVPTLRSGVWAAVGKLADFKAGTPTYVQVERQVADGWVGGTAVVGVHVVRTSDTEFEAFDPHCTHLGCPLAWSDGASSFVCPCHGGAFNASGEVVSGPPPRSLFRYETKVENGTAMVGQLVEEA